MNKSWNTLIQFESRDLIERAYNKRHDRNPSAEFVKEISSSFIQAREYFYNAARADITVKPLLQYYGVLAITRGLVLLLSKGLSASAIKQSHGLEAKGWRESLSNGISSIGSLRVMTGDGMFGELLRATENASYMRANSGAINWRVGYDIPPIGTDLSFEKIVSCIVELHEQYGVWKNTKISYLQLKSLQVEDDRYRLALSSRVEREVLDSVFPPQYCSEFKHTYGDSGNSVVEFPKSFEPQFSQLIDDKHFGIGDVYVVQPPDSSTRLNEVSAHYAASYVLGMLARYFPATWISLGRVERGDAVFPLINHLLDIIQTQYPRIILDYLNGPYDFEKK